MMAINSGQIESGTQLFNRLTQRPALENLHPILFPTGLSNSEVVEILGKGSTGKSLLVMELLARCILPVEYGGRGSSAALINTDLHFSIFKLVLMIESLLKPYKPQQAERVISSTLESLTILNCYSGDQTNFTLKNLEHILAGNMCINLLVIDGILANYWSERGEYTSINAYVNNILMEIKKVIDGRNIITIFTRSETATHTKQSANGVDKTLLLMQNDSNRAVTVYDHGSKEEFIKKFKINDLFEFS